jgi:glycogen debranching enzyme
MSSSESVSARSIVKAHVAEKSHLIMREPEGSLVYPWLCPGGFYAQLWDWDAVFCGVGLIPFGGSKYLAGSMKNFFTLTSADGVVPGCVSPKGASTTLNHAKPVLIWGSFLAAEDMKDFDQFYQFATQMRSLLIYWKRERCVDGVYVWHDTMESGADDLPYASIPSKHTSKWTEADERRISLPDVHTFLILERRAMASFCRAWAIGAGVADAVALEAEAKEHEGEALAIKDVLNSNLWYWMKDDDGSSKRRGYYVGYDAIDKKQLLNRTYQCAWPLWAGLTVGVAERDAALYELLQHDLRAAHGIRSTSTEDARYTLVDCIVPYSNWRGPVWINVNCVLAYTLASCGHKSEAIKLATELTTMLANDITKSGVMHECYNGDDGMPLSSESKGFLSWNVLIASLLDNLEADIDPFSSVIG